MKTNWQTNVKIINLPGLIPQTTAMICLHHDVTHPCSPQMKHVFLRFSSLAFFSLLRSAKVSMITPKMRLRMMTLIRKKNRRSYTTRKKKLGCCTTRGGGSGMDKGMEDSVRVNEGCTGEDRSENSRRAGGREIEDGETGNSRMVSGRGQWNSIRELQSKPKLLFHIEQGYFG